MAEFTASEWRRIHSRLDRSPDDYGLPRRRRNSIVMASWNIRKFGALTNSREEPSRSNGSWKLIERFCSRCDLIAIQEVQDSLESLRHLQEQLGDRYGIVVSDIAGGVPGQSGMRERLAFVYNTSRITHTELASDISFERSAVLAQLYQHREEFQDAFEAREASLDEWEQKNRDRLAAGKGKLSKPAFVLPRFIQFIRTPHIASFTVEPRGQAQPYDFAVINAHLMYGDKRKQKEERELEFKALLAWLIDRARERNRTYAENMVLFGDLNLDFEEVDVRRNAIARFISELNGRQLRGAPAKVNFPFIDRHPNAADVFRTNARKDQTYDQIAIFADDDPVATLITQFAGGEFGSK
jgi:hypothetical protein